MLALSPILAMWASSAVCQCWAHCHPYKLQQKRMRLRLRMPRTLPNPLPTIGDRCKDNVLCK